MAASAVSIQPKIVYGLRSDVKGNIQFTTKQEIIYPVSGVIAVQNCSTNKQKFLRLIENVVPTIITISPNRKLLAISERNDLNEKFSISIYDVATLKKRRTLMLPKEVPVPEPSNMVFTQDSKGLAVLSKEPDAFLTIFCFDKLQTIFVGRVSNASQKGLTAEHLSCNPSDPGLVAVGGRFTFKLLSRQDKSFGTIGTLTGEQKIITSLTWLTAEILVAGTSTNQLLFIEGGDPKANYDASSVDLIDLEKGKEADDEQPQKVNQSQPSLKAADVNCLTHFTTGFCFAQFNILYVFEKESAYIRYTRRTILEIPTGLYQRELYTIMNISINLEMDTVIVSAKHNQIYIGKLFVPETIRLQKMEFELFGESLHIDGIIEMSVCSWKPIILTAAKDRTVRIWNYETGEVEMIKKYETNVEGLALHPTGLFAAIGFSDQLHLMEILLSDFKTVKSFNFPECKNIMFSHQGHLLACANDNLISIVSVFSFHTIRTIKGHSGRILSLAWSHDDNCLVSSGNEGAIYEWDATTGKRINECIQKGIEYRSLAITHNKSIYVCTNTGVFREIHKSDVVREISPIYSDPLSCVALANSELMLFMSSEMGHLYNVQIPFLDAGGGTCTNYRLFNTKITCMKITFDDCYLITGSNDGTLVIWIILNNRDRTASVHPEHGKCSDIIVPRNDLIKRNKAIVGLESRVAEQTTEFEYKIEYMKTQHLEQMKQIHENYSKIIKKLENEKQMLTSNYNREINVVRVAIDEIKDENSKTSLQLESKFHEKIMVEFEKTVTIKSKMDEMKEEYEKLLRRSAGSLQDTVDTMESEFKQQLDERQKEKRELMNHIKLMKTEFAEYCKQLTVDNERRMIEMKMQYEQRLKDENEIILKWRAENGVLNKKIESIQAKCVDLERKKEILQIEHSRNKKLLPQYEQDIVELERELSIRDQTLIEKESRLLESYDKNQELENHIAQLNRRVADTRTQIEPLKAQIEQKNDQIVQLNLQLEDLKKNNMALKLQANKFRNKCYGLSVELKAQHEKYDTQQTLISRICRDVFVTVQDLQNTAKLKEHVVSLYQKYSNNLKLKQTLRLDEQQQAKSIRQGLYISRESKTSTRGFKYSKERTKLITDKMKLVNQLENLRIELNQKKPVK